MDQVAASIWRFQVDVGDVGDILRCNVLPLHKQDFTEKLEVVLFAGGLEVLAVASTRLFASSA